MRFLHLTDTSGKHHVVNPLHIVSIRENDGGCTVYMRGRAHPPIQLGETVELMGDALEACELDALPMERNRLRR